MLPQYLMVTLQLQWAFWGYAPFSDTPNFTEFQSNGSMLVLKLNQDEAFDLPQHFGLN
jgi:hypothetical protein